MFRINAKQAKKSHIFASKRKKFRFRFASFRFEAKMTAHPIPDPMLLLKKGSSISRFVCALYFIKYKNKFLLCLPCLCAGVPLPLVCWFRQLRVHYFALAERDPRLLEDM
jgi:hypothetical protein